MEEEQRHKILLQVEGIDDFTWENDALLLEDDKPSSENQNEAGSSDFFVPNNGVKEAGMSPFSERDEQLPDLTKSSEPEGARRKGKCNLRKSLAWDSAFFTSAGFLDAEELSSMIKGAEKSEKQILPVIEEDIRRSTDSVATLESDNLALENLEVELFQDIRASIQKSSKAFNAGVHGNTASGECNAGSSLKKTDPASQNQARPKIALKKPIGTSKSQIRQTLSTQGPVKTVHSQVAQSIARIGNPAPILPKPPQISSKGKPISTATAKRASLSATQVKKIENDKTRIGTATGKRDEASKLPVISGARRVLPKPALSSKCSSQGSSTSTKAESVRSSPSDSSRSVSSNQSGKSPSAAARKKVADRTVKPPSSHSTVKTPSKTTTKNRATIENSALTSHLMSSKICSSISPASSISEWSSASSTSSSTINQRSNKSRTSSDRSSCRSLDNDTLPSDLNNHSKSQILDGHKSEGLALHDESTRKSTAQTGTLSHPAFVKPSGLRMPSPKIGFFDGAKSVRTPIGSTHPHASLPTVLPKIGAAACSPHRSLNMKPKMGKLPQTRNPSAFADTKPATQKPSSPMSLEEKLIASSHISSDLKDSPTLSLDVYEENGEESCLKIEGVGVGPSKANHASSTGSGAFINESAGSPILLQGGKSMNMEETAGSTNAFQVDAIGDTCASNFKYEGNLSSPKRNRDVTDCQSEHKDKSPALRRMDEKENSVSAEQAGEYKRKPGHLSPDIDNQADGHLNDQLEPGSLFSSPATLSIALRSPLVDMNVAPVSDS